MDFLKKLTMVILAIVVAAWALVAKILINMITDKREEN